MLKTEPDDLIQKLGSSEKASLRLLLDLPETSLTQGSRSFFSRFPWAGVIFFPKNIRSREQVLGFIQELQAIHAEKLPGYPLWVSVDQEGGSVSPLEGLVTPSPGNMALSAAGDLEAVYAFSRLAGSELRQLGFNVNFSPVVDVNSNPENPIIGIRSFGEDPSRVAEYGAAMIRGLQEEGVLATAKHFPGHGDTAKDSHVDLPVVTRPEAEVRRIDLHPFRQAVASGVWGIMTAHVIFTSLDDLPATLSRKILTGILRKELGFDGLIFTDSFEMAAMKEHFDLEEAVLQSVKAGADVLLALGERAAQEAIFEILRKAIEKKKLEDEAVVPPLRRILSTRKRLSAFESQEVFRVKPDLVRKVHEESVTLVSGPERLPLSRSTPIFLSPEATDRIDLFQEAFAGSRLVGWPWPAEEGERILMLGERRLLGHAVEGAVKAWPKPPLAVVSMGNPYLLKRFNSEIKMTTYHLSALFLEEIRQVIFEGKKAAGKLPVTL